MELLHLERCFITRALSTCLSKSPEAKPPPGSPYRAPKYRKMLHLQMPLYITLKVPRKETPLQVPLMEPLHRERCSISGAPQKRKSPSGFPLQSPYIEKYVPSPEPSLHIFKVHRKEPPSRFPSQSPTETEAPFPEPSSTCLSQCPVKEPPLQVPYQDPDGERFSSPGPTLHTSQNSK
jgi:hypothetical protein